MNLKKFRSCQNIISSVIFLAVLSFFCYTTQFKLTDIQLSRWSANNKFSWIWNLSIVMLAISFHFNYKNFINSFPKINKKFTIDILFGITTICLFLTGLINTSFLFYHNIVAWIYFLAAPIAIFSFAHFNVENIPVKTWRTNLIIALLTVVVPIITILCFKTIFLYEGLAIPEILHTLLIMTWNLNAIRNK